MSIPSGPIWTEPLDYPTPGVYPSAPRKAELLGDVFRTAGVELGAYDERIATWLVQAADWSTFAVIASWVARAGAASEQQRTRREKRAALLAHIEKAEMADTAAARAVLPELRQELAALNAEDEREKSSHQADATPDKASAHEARLAQLLDTIRARPGKWTTGLVQGVRRTTGGPVQRGTARRDLEELHRRGHLARHGAGDGRYYTLRRREEPR